MVSPEKVSRLAPRRGREPGLCISSGGISWGWATDIRRHERQLLSFEDQSATRPSILDPRYEGSVEAYPAYTLFSQVHPSWHCGSRWTPRREPRTCLTPAYHLCGLREFMSCVVNVNTLHHKRITRFAIFDKVCVTSGKHFYFIPSCNRSDCDIAGFLQRTRKTPVSDFSFLYIFTDLIREVEVATLRSWHGRRNKVFFFLCLEWALENRLIFDTQCIYNVCTRICRWFVVHAWSTESEGTFLYAPHTSICSCDNNRQPREYPHLQIYSCYPIQKVKGSLRCARFLPN